MSYLPIILVRRRLGTVSGALTALHSAIKEPRKLWNRPNSTGFKILSLTTVTGSCRKDKMGPEILSDESRLVGLADGARMLHWASMARRYRRIIKCTMGYDNCIKLPNGNRFHRNSKFQTGSDSSGVYIQIYPHHRPHPARSTVSAWGSRGSRDRSLMHAVNRGPSMPFLLLRPLLLRCLPSSYAAIKKRNGRRWWARRARLRLLLRWPRR